MSTRSTCHRPRAACPAGVRVLAGTLAFALAIPLALTLGARPVWAGPPGDGDGSEAEATAEQDPGPQLIPPKAKAPVRYEYPPELLEREQPPVGIVRLQYVVGTDGVPKEIEVLEGVDPRLDAVAREAVAALRFEAASYDGEAVEVVLAIDIGFALPTAPEDRGDDTSSDSNDDSGEDSGEDAGEDAGEDSGEDSESADAGPIRITGALLEAGRGAPVTGATVLAVPAKELPEGKVRQQRYGEEAEAEPAWLIRAVSDDAGRFDLRAVPDGRVRLIFLAGNYERLEWVVTLSADAQLDGKYFLTRSAGNPFRTEVTVDRETMPEAVIRSIAIEQVNEIPGTYGDALKAVQNFPGVARAPFGAGQLTIRGSAPADSGVYLGYHEIPTLFHFGGLTSVFNSDILAQIDFIPGNFDSRYGDAIGGIINVQPRKGRRDGYHGYIDTDLFDTGVLVEGRAGAGSFVLSARRSYVDLILPAVIPDEVGLGLTLAPRYWDYQALFDYPLPEPVGGELSVRVFGSDDRSKLLFAAQNDAEPDARNSLETIQWFHRADLVWRKLDGPWEFLITPSYKREFFSGSIFGQTRFDVESDTFSGRAELSRMLSKRARLRLGAEFVGSWYTGRAEFPGYESGGGGPSPALGSASTRETDYVRLLPALYSTLTLRLTDELMLFPGLRLSHYNDKAQLARTVVDPRLRFIWQLTDGTAFKGGVGLYSQGPGLLQGDAVFGNPRALPERSLHTSLALAQDLPWEVTLELTGFYKRLWSLLSASTDLRLPPGQDPSGQNFANTGTGHIYGGELLLQKPLGDRFYGWLSYTLMRSVRTPAPGQAQRLFDFDQTHILTLILSYDFPDNWRIGARFRVVSGNPTTPIKNGIVDAGAGGVDQIAILGPVNGDRLPTFHQLDLRVDKTWVYRRIEVTSYLDIQNVYNAENTEFLNYSYDYQQVQPILSLPTAPSIGMKIEW